MLNWSPAMGHDYQRSFPPRKLIKSWKNVYMVKPTPVKFLQDTQNSVYRTS